jgi:HEAT repeat protein
MRRTLWLAAAVCGALTLPARAAAQTPDITGGMVMPLTLGQEVNQASTITVLRVEGVNRDEQVITFRKAADLKGRAPDGEVRHRIDWPGSERDRQAVLDWARPGKVAVCFQDGDRCRTCLGHFWYLSGAEDPTLWDAACPLEGCPVTYAGPAEKVREHVAAILAGREVVVTAQALEDNGYYRADGHSPVYQDWLHGRKGRVCRVKASLRITSLEESEGEDSRGFVGWGVGGPEVVPVLAAALADRDPLVRAEAAGDLEQLGPLARPALPGLRATLNDPDPYVRVYAAEALARIDRDGRRAVPAIGEGLRDRDAHVRAAAAGALAALGPPAEDAGPELRAVLGRDPEAEVRRAAAFALGEVMAQAHDRRQVEEAVAALARSVREDQDSNVSYWAARALLRFGAGARGAVPVLLAALRDRRPRVAETAADGLARLGPDVVPDLGDALLDRKCQARRPAAQYLGDLGPEARAAFPALVRTLRDEDVWLRLGAASALVRIDADAGAAAAVPALAEIVDSKKNHPVVQNALTALKDLGPRARAAVPALARALQDDDRLFRNRAADALGAVGPGAAAAVPALGELLQNENRTLRVAAARALWRINRDRAAVAMLIQICEEKDGHLGEAVDALGEIGPDAELAVPVLKRALQDATYPEREPLALALWRLQRPTEVSGVVSDPRQEALAVLLRLLREGTVLERWSAIRAVRDVGPEARAAVPALVRLLQNEEPSLRDEAANALRAVDPGAREAVPMLTALLGDANPYVRLAAARALARGERRPPELVPVLVHLLEWSSDLRDDAAATLAALGPDARPAVPALRRLLRDSDRNVYVAAARALRQLDPDAASDGQ